MRPLRTRVKVCGLCSAADARAAVRAGADALGVILVADSPRHVTPEEAAHILSDAPPLVTTVGVFMDAGLDEAADIAGRLRLGAVQLHGAESPEYCAAMPVPVIKSFRVGEGFDVSSIEAYRGSVAAVLLDTLVPGAPGGTGRTFDWAAFAGIPDVAPLIVAGGLKPINVGAAIRALRPFAVDVSSGVEERVRHKDSTRLAAFIEAVRTADTHEE